MSILFGRIRHYLIQQRTLLVLGFVAFFLGALLGVVFYESLQQMMLQMFEELQNRIGPVTQGSELFIKIFINNVLAALVFIGTGIFFGIYPFFGLIVNGMAIGYLWQAVNLAGQSPWKMVLYGILPHGIFEIPAIVVAAAFGMRLGLQAWRSLWAAIRPAYRQQMPARPWRQLMNQLPLTINIVLGLLLAAAVIESSLTVWLMQQYVAGGNFG